MRSALTVLLSGGLDSTTLLHYLRHTRPGVDIHALTFQYGQRHACEVQCAVWQANAAGVAVHEVFDLNILRRLAGAATALIDGAPVPALSDVPPAQLNQPPTYVSHRNLLLLSLAAAYSEAHGIVEVFYAAQHQRCYGYWDCTEKFLQRMNDLLALNRGSAVKVHAPFAALDKAAVLQIGLRLGVDYSHTWTCYRGGTQACGVCPACIERLAAFQATGATDPLQYAPPSVR